MPRRDPVSTIQDMSQIEELKTKINNLAEDNPTACEGLIRELHKMLSHISIADVREQLLFDLKVVAYRGLKSDLATMVEENGLQMEALALVLNYLTTVDELAQYLFKCYKNEPERDALVAVKRRLMPKLEVLGGLCAFHIDITKDWAQKLVKVAPSLQALARLHLHEVEEVCHGADHGEINDINLLVKLAESRCWQTVDGQQLSQTGAEDGKEKAIDKEKLENAKLLLNEAREMAKEQTDEAKRSFNEKMVEIAKILNLPPHWDKHDTGVNPEELLKELDGIIEQLKCIVEVSDAYRDDNEVVRNASGGRALCGIYFSEHTSPITPELPVLAMPRKLHLSSPNNSQQVRYIKFSEAKAAANYVQTVKSTSSNIGLSIGGFQELFHEGGGGHYSSTDREDGRVSQKVQTRSASVVQYIWIATKTFKIEQEQMKLTASAKKMARASVKDEKTARLFMQRYGSHYPAGLHTLGGVLFRIVDAESSNTTETSFLTGKAAQQLQGQLSFGFLGGLFGISASIGGGRSKIKGKSSAHDSEMEDISYTFSSQAMGPATTNPAAFSKLLANNSTWALIDRGSKLAYIPIWELIRELDCDFQVAADILEKTWIKDEEGHREAVREKWKNSAYRLAKEHEVANKVDQGGTYILKIANFTQKLSEAKDKNSHGEIEGEPFFPAPHGYKLRLCVCLNETGGDSEIGRMGVFIHMMRGDHDAILPWPFKKKCTFTVIDQEEDEETRENIEKTLVPACQKQFQRPTTECSEGFGFKSFVSHDTLKTHKYIVDDTVFVKLHV